MDALKSNMKIELRQEHWRRILEDVENQAPLEACGLLAGKNGRVEKVYPIANVLASAVRFRMAPEEQLQAFLDIEALNLDLLAIYHSHPGGPPWPSPTDLAEFAYPGVLYLICYRRAGRWTCSCFSILESEVESVQVEFIPGE